MDFTRAVEKQVEGVPGRGGLLQQIKPRQEEFRVAIRTTAPCFVPRYKGSQSQEMVFEGGANEDWEPYRRLSFLEGEEDYGEIGLDDGKEIFIDDVLETAEWYAVLAGPLCSHAHRECLIQGGHERTAKQLSIHCPEGVHHRHRQPMGLPCKDIIRRHCQETEGNNIARRGLPFRNLRPRWFEATSFVSRSL